MSTALHTGMSYITIDQSKRLGQQLRRFTDLTIESLDLYRRLAAILDLQSNEEAESAFGLPPGKGGEVKALMAGLAAAVPADDLRAALVQIG